MTVHFIGAGPGAADLITVRGARLLASCPVCLFAGSVVPRAVLSHCGPGTRCVDTAGLDLPSIVALCTEAHGRGQDVARLHSGDLSVFSAVAEQLRELRQRDVPVSLTPGVPAFAAAAAVLEAELTVPEVAQSVVLTRLAGRASAMPPGETLDAFGRTGATLAIHLAVHRLPEIVAVLLPIYGAHCPAAVVARATWPEERVVTGTLATLAADAAGIDRTALVLVGPALAGAGRNSALYDPGYVRRFRGG